MSWVNDPETKFFFGSIWWIFKLPFRIGWLFSRMAFHLGKAEYAKSKLRADEAAKLRDRERVSREVRALRAALLAVGDRRLTQEGIFERMAAVVDRFDVSRDGVEPPRQIFEGFAASAWVWYKEENFYQLKEPDYAEPVGEAEYLDYLRGKKDTFERIDEINDALVEAFCVAYLNFVSGLPDDAFATGESILRVDLPDALGSVLERGRDIAQAFFTDRCKELGILERLRKQFQENDQNAEKRYPTKRQHVDALFDDTTFDRLLDMQIPFEVPLDKQLEHVMIAAGSGHGKSQLIGALIATHLQSPDPPGMIVLDSTGDFAEKISRLDVFHPETGRLRGKLLVIDPADSPQLNMFDIENVRKKGYGARDLEQIEADITNLFNYVFESIGGEFTSQQGAGFTFLVRLLLQMPGATINTMRDILEVKTKSFEDAPRHIRDAVAKLDPTSQSYFQNQFFTLNMQSTREAVARRLYLILQNQSFERMFTGRNRVDLFQAMQDGKIILVNSNKDLLQKQASALFGRYVIARVMSAAFERATIKNMDDRRPCMLFIDEASEYFDSAIDTLLSQIRKYRLGVCVAFQFFGQLDDRLRLSVLGNTTVKFAGGLAAPEARMIAHEMRTEDAFVLAQKRDGRNKPPRWSRFATYVKSLTDEAVSVDVPFFSLENLPKLSRPEHERLLAANREAVCPYEPPPPPAATPPPPPPQPPPAAADPGEEPPRPPPQPPRTAKPKVKIKKKSPPKGGDEDGTTEWS